MKVTVILRQAPPGAASVADRAALEAALQLKLQTGGSVTAVCLGSETAVSALREAVSMGCDDALLIRTDRIERQAPNPALDAFILAAALKSSDFDVILTSCWAVDADAVQCGFLLAERLHLPEAGFVSELSSTDSGTGSDAGSGAGGSTGSGAGGSTGSDAGGSTGSGLCRRLLAKRQFEDQIQTLMLPLPCLVSVLPQPEAGFYPTAKGITRAWSMTIPSRFAEDLVNDSEEKLLPSVRLLSTVKMEAINMETGKKKDGTKILSLPGREAAAAVLETLISHHIL